jgi:hypothetical protein
MPIVEEGEMTTTAVVSPVSAGAGSEIGTIGTLVTPELLEMEAPFRRVEVRDNTTEKGG